MKNMLKYQYLKEFKPCKKEMNLSTAYFSMREKFIFLSLKIYLFQKIFNHNVKIF